jgi:hypothetical protein
MHGACDCDCGGGAVLRWRTRSQDLLVNQNRMAFFLQRVQCGAWARVTIGRGAWARVTIGLKSWARDTIGLKSWARVTVDRGAWARVPVLVARGHCRVSILTVVDTGQSTAVPVVVTKLSPATAGARGPHAPRRPLFGVPGPAAGLPVRPAPLGEESRRRRRGARRGVPAAEWNPAPAIRIASELMRGGACGPSIARGYLYPLGSLGPPLQSSEQQLPTRLGELAGMLAWRSDARSALHHRSVIVYHIHEHIR